MKNTISVITPAHPIRMTSGMILRAQTSVGQQTLLPEAHIVTVDTERQGACPTRQRALEMARTEWVAFLDSDDMFMANHLEAMLNHALETESDFVYSWFQLIQIFADGSVRDHKDKDPIFPPGHFLNDWNPEDPIETTITTLVRTEIAQQVGFQTLNRGEGNSGEDRFFTLGCMDAGAKISHLKQRTWFWVHHQQVDLTMGNTGGLPGRGDDTAY